MDRNLTEVAACQLVVCALGEEEYGLPVGQVREIVRYTEPRPVASDVPWMRGVVSLRGRLVPVHDLAARLGLVTSPAGVRLRSPEGESRFPPGVRLRSPEGESRFPPGVRLRSPEGESRFPPGVRLRSPEGEARFPTPPPTAKLVIVETADEPVGVLVDDVVEVLTVAAAQLEPVPSGSGQIARVGDRLVLLLDGEELGA